MIIDSSLTRQLCPDMASYRLLEDGRIEVDGEVIQYEKDSRRANLVAQIWSDMGPQILRASQVHDVPAAWITGIVVIESGGDPSACSPCTKDICSMAPNCGGPCCAYGVMQVIDSTAKSFCNRSGPSLTGDMEGGLDCGTKVFRYLLDRSAGDPLIAAKKYNGGGIKCGAGGIFGVGGQGNFVEVFVRSANTFRQFAVDGFPTVKLEEVAEQGFPWWGWAALLGVGVAVVVKGSKR